MDLPVKGKRIRFCRCNKGGVRGEQKDEVWIGWENDLGE